MKIFFTLHYGLLMVIPAFAQEELSEAEKLAIQVSVLETSIENLNKLKVSGYIQPQFQWGQENASLKVGAANEDMTNSFSRIGIRRGRIKFTYDASLLTSGVFQLDVTEKGVSFKDVYLNIKDPWIQSLQLRAGIFDRPFGNEISYSSSRRESPERSTLFQTLFPDERDLGLMLLLQAPKTSPWNILKLEAGLFAGNGIKVETDSQRDFIGHLSLTKNIGNVTFGGGVSYYKGGVYQATSDVYSMKGNQFVADNTVENKGKFAKREYTGFDFQFASLTGAGMSQVRAEYIFGQQPGVKGSSKSPNWAALPSGLLSDGTADSAADTYIRPFSGWYVIFVQDLGLLPFSLVAKYDEYNPNTKVKGNDAGLTNGVSKTDLTQNTLGFGALWRISSELRLQLFYENVQHENSQNIAGYESVRKADVFTLRFQYKF